MPLDVIEAVFEVDGYDFVADVIVVFDVEPVDGYRDDIIGRVIRLAYSDVVGSILRCDVQFKPKIRSLQ